MSETLKKIPENIQKLILDNFFDAHIKMSTILEIVNKEYEEKMSLEELYDFLYEYEKQSGKKLRRSSSKVSEKLKQFIFNKRLIGVPYYIIIKELKDNGINISIQKARKICKEAFDDNGIEVTYKVHKKGMFVIVRENTINSFINDKGMKKEDIKEYFNNLGINLDIPYVYYKNEKYGVYEVINNHIKDIIYTSRKTGNSYRSIVNKLENLGIEISYETVRKNCKKFFKEKNEKEPKAKYSTIHIQKRKYDVPEIYKLRKEGVSYAEITEIIRAEKYPEISYETIRAIGKSEFRKRDEKEPNILLSYDLEKDSINKDILRLREEGKSYKEITRILNDNGNNINSSKVAYRCKKIFESLNRVDTFANHRGRKSEIEPIDDVIYTLRKNGYTDGRILEFLGKKGINISKKNLETRTIKIFKFHGERVPKGVIRKSKKGANITADNSKLLELIYKVAKEKNASKEQVDKFIKEVGEMYNTKLDVEYIDKERG